MRTLAPIRLGITSGLARLALIVICLAAACPILAAVLSRLGWDSKNFSHTFGSLTPTKNVEATKCIHPTRFLKPLLVSILLSATTLPAQSTVILDRVVAVVNRHAILASDIDDEIRLSVLDPARAGRGVLTRPHALDQLISQALIEQQIRREDTQADEPTQEEVNARLAEIRKELPACVHENCASDAGWKAFLAAHDLTPERVDAYLRYRIEILRFIEDRFRPGIHISPQDIETYYRDTLLPEYGPGEAIPSLARVSPRIEEILLQQQVNLFFDEWLTNLRKQGDVEVLDPSLESAETPATKPSDQNGAKGGEGKGGR